MHATDLDESPAHSRKRHRSSKKKRLRKKKRASLEANITAEEDEIEHEENIIQDQTEDSDQESSEEEHHTPQKPKVTSQHHNQEQDVQVRTQVEENDQDSSDENDEVIDYERKRRENILRNQAYLKSVGISTAKFAARTSISFEAEKEAEQQLLAEKRALRAAEEKNSQWTEVEEEEQNSSDEDDNEMTEYERKRRENILRNQAYLKGVGMSTAKFAARTSIGFEAEKEAKKQLLAEKRALRAADEESPQSPQSPQSPRRRSLRIRKKVTDLGRSRLRSANTRLKSEKQQIDLGHPLDILDAKAMRQPIGCRIYVMDATDDEGKEFCKGLAGGVHTFKTNETGDDVDYALGDTDMAKALPYCTTSMAFLPRSDRVVVAAGDKEGHVALWSPSSDGSDSEAALSRPHGYPVSHLIFPDSSTLVSSSIDGTVREFDFWTTTTSPIGDLSQETGISSLIGSGNPQFYYAACEDGTLRLVDRRARKMFNAQYSLHKTRINSVDQHPSLAHCIATASRDATVCLWDKRKISPEDNAPLARLLHKKNVTSAQFSPGDGSWLAAVGYNSYFDMYNTSNLVNCNESGKNSFTIPNWVRVPHKTYTNVKANLHPAWDPRRKDRLVIACLDKPARLQIFRAGQRQPIQELISTRLSRNPKFHAADLMTAYHPSLDIIASSNSNGILSLWRAKPKE